MASLTMSPKNCNALAECGPFADASNVTCPLSVCCSQFGFCGTTSDFCGEGCKSNCGGPKIPSCGATQSSATTKRIGYYEGWAVSRKCMSYEPEQISADTLTHINFAFALISSTFEVIEMTKGDSDLWRRTTALKEGRPALKVFLSIGGWTFNDKPTQNIFSDMVGSTANTNTFIKSVLSVMETYAFDGIDVDWEYPAAWDRGGIPADKENYVTFMAAVKTAFAPKKYGLTFTAPSSYWYLQNFDLPGLLKHADWVNVMTYDLHGTWDGVDPFIGYVVGSHTNLTEIDEAFQLYWRVGVDPKQMVMGMGFYGRSFTLSTPDCNHAGCPWTSGGNEGPCSGNSGTLMWSEIESVLTAVQKPPNIDEVAAVAYISWGNQWVSFDTDQTFAIKMNYANDHCIGGTMIWSVDQDDNNYNALEALYPGLTGIGSRDTNLVSSAGPCYVGDCGSKSCYPDNLITSVYYNPLTGNCDLKKGIPAVLCCPEIKGKTCAKRGYTDDKTPCVPQCNEDEILIGKDIIGDTTNQVCFGGMTAICCTADLPAPADCIFTECSTTPDTTCPSGFSHFQTSLSTARGVCASGKSQGFCCTNPLPYANCEWKGTPPLCDDASCGIGQLTIFNDAVGDGTLACAGGATRQYCCDPPVDLPAPFGDIFPSGVPDSGNDIFHVDLDPDVGTLSKAVKTESGTSSTFKESDNENSGAFGELFIDSPKASSVSSLSIQSNWVITGCNAQSDQPQQVAMYCSKANSPACQHVLIGGAEHTIVEMPKSCGLGPYARVASLDVHPNQTVLSGFHAKAKPASESVFLLSFDYNFAAIPASNGPVYMRADVTDMPGYWDSVVDSPPERRQWLEERGLWQNPKEKRWWGAFKTWLSKITTLEVDKSQTRTFFWSDTWNIFHQESHCDGPPQFDASLDISLTGTANMNARYGFYLQGTVVPPAVTASYVHFSSDASASATFTVQGEALVQYNSDRVTFASFGFPGLYYPGLLTVGPSLVLEGYIAGQLSVQGQLTTSLTYQFPPINYALGNTGTDTIGPAANPSPPAQLVKYSLGYNVDLSGDVTVHMVPTIQLGISVLNGQLIDAQAYVSADLYAGIAINGSVSLASALEVCIAPHFGLIVTGGVTGNVLFWEASTTPFTFYNKDHVFADKCFSSMQQPSLRRSQIEHEMGTGLPYPTPTKRGARVIETRGRGKREIEAIPSLEKRVASVPTCPGFLNCPNVDNQIGQDNTDNDIYSDYPGDVDDDSVFRRAFDLGEAFDEELALNSSFVLRPSPGVTVASCPGFSFDPFPYDQAGNNFYNLASPTTLDGNFKAYATDVGRVNVNTYGREHVYEMQLLTDFINTLAQSPALWMNAAGTTNYCSWAKSFINSPSSYSQVNNGKGLSVVQRLQSCQPSNSKSVIAGGNKMPWLESTANGIKARAFTGTALKSKSTFQRYSYSKKVFEIRAATSLLSYMLDGPVADQFVLVSNCVKDVWADFYTGYNADSKVDAPNKGNFNMATTYTTYVRGKVQNFFLNLRTGVTQFIGFYSDSAGGDTVQKNVDLNYGKLSTQGATPVSANDLNNNIFSQFSGASLIKLTVRL
ncbi:hypothetical protein D9619_003681 [Psilocybe cf. subviscida]|uniref:Chitinase n=1 Tax=Psilocybe cf. subviscida TaxID=2480587 RepID=A0A8H5AWF5_9AGAR|nr:hypothetical protein D9619_003681 [Psilocybe cf. subviscida]